MSDPRKGRPSASNMHRYAACKGAWWAEQQAIYGGHVEPKSDEAASGTRIHDYLAGKQPDTVLTSEELWLAMRCREQAVSVEEMFMAAHILDNEQIERIPEKRIWFRGDLFSGEPDVVLKHRNRALIIDYKTGSGDVESAEENMQLRALTVLVTAADPKITEVTTAIVQPLAGKPSVCTYTWDHILKATEEIVELVHTIEQPGHPRTPSEKACKYCKARFTCKERNATMEVVKAYGSGAVMAPMDVLRVLESKAIITKIIKDAEEQAKELLKADPDALPGWKLDKPRKNESIIDPNTLYARCVEAGVKPENFTKAVTITKTALKEVIEHDLGLKGKPVEDKLKELCAGLVEVKECEPSLKRIK